MSKTEKSILQFITCKRKGEILRILRILRSLVATLKIIYILKYKI